jgi:hypothetical protein
MTKIDSEKTTLTIGLKELISYVLGIILGMTALFYTFYNIAMSNMNERHNETQKTIEKIQVDLDKTKNDVSDVRDMQIKSGSYLEIILKQTMDKKSNIEDTKGGINH